MASAQLVKFTPKSDEEEKVAIVTGGNSGIGYEVAKKLSILGFHVIIACRSKENAQEALDRMKKELINDEETKEFGPSAFRVEFMRLDLSSLSSTMDFVNEFKTRALSLHVLVCNAGIAFVAKGLTVDGFERHFQVNYLSHFLLILHLLPVCFATPCDDVKIVMVSSDLHMVGEYRLSNVNGDDSYGRLKFYGNSKLYQVMLGYSLARRLEGTNVSISSVHPGLVKTGANRAFSDSVGFSLYYWIATKTFIARSASQGADSVMNAVLDKDNNGIYYGKTQRRAPSKTSRNKRNQEEFWEHSLDCLKDFVTQDFIHSLQFHSSE